MTEGAKAPRSKKKKKKKSKKKAQKKRKKGAKRRKKGKSSARHRRPLFFGGWGIGSRSDSMLQGMSLTGKGAFANAFRDLAILSKMISIFLIYNHPYPSPPPPPSSPPSLGLAAHDLQKLASRTRISQSALGGPTLPRHFTQLLPSMVHDPIDHPRHGQYPAYDRAGGCEEMGE